MPQYEIVVRVDPPYRFGLTDGRMPVFPANALPLLCWTPGGDSWAEPSGSGETVRSYDDRFLIEVEIDGIRVSGDDNLFRVWLNAPDLDAAAVHAEALIWRIFAVQSLLSEKVVVDDISVKAIEIRYQGVVFTEDPSAGGALCIYDLRSLEERVRQSALLLRGLTNDKRLEQALRYLSIGDDMAFMRKDHQSKELVDEISPLRFLQYWKALTTITGDPSRDRDHQSTSTRLGLGRQYFRHQIRPLKDLRDSFDVAHITDPDAPMIVSRSDVVKCREVAARVVVAYAENKRADQH